MSADSGRHAAPDRFDPAGCPWVLRARWAIQHGAHKLPREHTSHRAEGDR